MAKNTKINKKMKDEIIQELSQAIPKIESSEEFDFDDFANAFNPPKPNGKKGPRLQMEVPPPTPIEPPVIPEVETPIKKPRKRRTKKVVEEIIPPPDNQLTVKRLMEGLGNDKYTPEAATRMAEAFGFSGDKSKLHEIENTFINLGEGDSSQLGKVVDFVRGETDGNYSYKNVENLKGYGFDSVALSTDLEDIHNAKVKSENKFNAYKDFGDNLHKDKTEIRDSIKTMNSLKEKFGDGNILTPEEVESYKKSGEVLNQHSATYKQLVEEHGTPAQGTFESNQIFQEMKEAGKTGYRDYEIAGEEGKQYFKKKTIEPIQETVASHLEKMNSNGEFANAKDIDISEYLKKNTLEEFGDDTLNNLVNLRKKGVPLDDEANALIETGAKLKNSGIGADSTVHSDFNNAIANYRGEYNNVTENDVNFINNNKEFSIGIERKDGKFVPTQNTIDAVNDAYSPLEINGNKALKNLSEGRYDPAGDYSGINEHLGFYKNKVDLLEEYGDVPGSPFSNMEELDNLIDKGINNVRELKDGGKYGHTPESYLKEKFIAGTDEDARGLINKIHGGSKDFTNAELDVLTDVGHKGVDFAEYATGNVTDNEIDMFLKHNSDIDIETTYAKTKRQLFKDKIGLGEKTIRETASENAKKIVENMPNNEKGAYLNFKRRDIGSSKVLTNTAEEIRKGDFSQEELVAKLYDIEQVKAPFTSREEAIERYSRNPEKVIKNIEDNIESGLKGNMFDEKTKEALNKEIEKNNGLGIGITEKVQKSLNKDPDVSSAYKEYIDGSHSKLERATSKIKDGEINTARLGEYAKEAVENLSEGPLPNIGGKATKFLEKIKGMHKGGIATMAGIAVAGATIAGVSSVVSSAQEERKNKEQQLANLMAMQSGNARGMY